MKGNLIEQTGQQLLAWNQIDWDQVERTVRRLQERIYRATQRQEWRTVRSLQKLLARTTANKLLAIRRVTQQNQGKRTAGVDGKVYLTAEARSGLASNDFSLHKYRPLPVKRVYIPKPNGKLRPLGIPSIRDRIYQAIVKAALEPEWEARFEANSYGFRPGRGCMDAIQALHITLNHAGCSEWVLDADISGCFDHIAHGPLLARIPVFRTVVRRWLKAGVVELGHYQPTDEGTPQGGVISPLLANIALDGMERLFHCESRTGQPVEPSQRGGANRGINLVRYADDFVVSARSRATLENYVRPQLESFLSQRGLQLSEAKTRIVHIDEGFNFLGFTLRRFKAKVLTMPQKAKVAAHVRRLKEETVALRQSTPETLVKCLNPLIQGWCNYYRYASSARTYRRVSYQLWRLLWQWATRRHPNWPAKRVARQYWKTVGRRRWMFGNREVTLRQPYDTKIARWIKVRGRASPYDPQLRDYWTKRRQRAVSAQIHSWLKLTALRQQKYRCAHCQVAFDQEDEIDLHHKVPQAQGGASTIANLVAVHPYCHVQIHAGGDIEVCKA